MPLRTHVTRSDRFHKPFWKIPSPTIIVPGSPAKFGSLKTTTQRSRRLQLVHRLLTNLTRSSRDCYPKSPLPGGRLTWPVSRDSDFHYIPQSSHIYLGRLYSSRGLQFDQDGLHPLNTAASMVVGNTGRSFGKKKLRGDSTVNKLLLYIFKNPISFAEPNRYLPLEECDGSGNIHY